MHPQTPIQAPGAPSPPSPTRERTRLAPSPTGALHLGNARTFLVNWALARRHGWDILLRIEDLDTPRVKPGVIDQTIDTLRWLGLDWDDGPISQLDDLGPYRDAMRALAARSLVYPCELTRAQIDAAANAPHADEHEQRFPPELRPPTRPATFDDEATNWRFEVEPGVVPFFDAFAGEQAIDPAATVGDFVVWTKRAQPSYQLAVVVDDARQGVTQVVRGDDLLDSAARQSLLYDALDLSPRPMYTHLPLVRGADGRRLAKRHGDTRLTHYRERGVQPERLIALLARWSGVEGAPVAMSAREFLDAFDLRTMPHSDVTYTQEDERWLLA
ncbi:MAG: tRNA glutamyl-Q(34) synthetase GluQRS [Phycisphaerales bacterium]